MRKNIIIILILLLLASFCLNVFQFRQNDKFDDEVSRDVIVDTVRFEKPVVKDSTITRYITKIVPIKVRANEISASPVCKTDSLLDSVSVTIPITQKIYEDSLYKAYVSGYAVNLDSIFVNRFTERIYIRSPTSKQKRFGVGIQTGIGYTPKGFQPYVGIGIDIRLFSF